MAAIAVPLSVTRDAPRAPSRWRRVGLAGFLFFLVQGLLWLIVPALVWAGS